MKGTENQMNQREGADDRRPGLGRESGGGEGGGRETWRWRRKRRGVDPG